MHAFFSMPTTSPQPLQKNAPALGPKHGEEERRSRVASRVKRTNKRLSRAARDTKTISVERAWHIYAVTGSVKQTRKLVKETKKLVERTRKLLKARALAQTQPEVKAEGMHG
jgi:hypothetical protein